MKVSSPKMNSPQITDPVFVSGYPSELSPMARTRRAGHGIAERTELYCAGIELCNLFSLTFAQSVSVRRRRKQELEEVTAHGIPEFCVLGLGVDRLVMLLANKTTVQEVVQFPGVGQEVSSLVSSNRVPNADIEEYLDKVKSNQNRPRRGSTRGTPRPES